MPHDHTLQDGSITMSTNDVEFIREALIRIESKVDAYHLEDAQRITVLETQNKPLFDNGQPGIVTKHADRISKLEKKDSWRDGKTVGISAAISIVVALIPYFYKIIFK